MSANFNALLNAATVATNHHVQATVAAASGAHVAAGQGTTAAVHGAATHGHGAATVAAGNVSAAAGSGNTAQQSAANQAPVAQAPGNGGNAVPSAPIVIGALNAAGQPASSPGLPTPGVVALRRTDSTTDWNPQQDNGQYYSARLGGSVDELFADALSEDQPDSSLPGYPLVFPRNLFTPAAAAAAAASAAAAAAAAAANAANAAPGPAANTEPVLAKFYADLVAESAGAEGGLTWNDVRSEPGERLAVPASHAMRPDEYQRIRRYLLNPNSADTLLLAAEAAASVNKAENLRYLLDLRAAQRRKPAWLRERFQMGAEVVLANKDARTRRKIRPAVDQAASFAQDLLPAPPPPVPSLLGLVVVAAAELLVGAVTGLLKRKRGADDDEDEDREERPAKRACVGQERDPQRRFAFLSDVPVAPPLPPRPLQGLLAATNPGPLPYNGAATFPALYLTSDVATQTGEKPDSSAVAGPSRQPLRRTQSQEDAAVTIGPRRTLVIDRLKPEPTPLLTDPGESAAPLAAGEKRVRFALHTESTRPDRCDLAPRRSLMGVEDDLETGADAHPLQVLPVGVFSKREWKTYRAAQLRRMEERRLFGGPPTDPTARHSWSHPHGEFKTYRDAQTQYEMPELPPTPTPSPVRFPAHLASPPPSPSPSWASSPSPSREASARKQLRRGSRAGKQVKRRRALKEAATATETADVKMGTDDE